MPAWMLLLAQSMPVLVALSVVLAALRAIKSGQPWMVFFEDDFYYYLKVAQNIAHGAGSTFNGVAPTNGYHPLWLLALTVVSFFTTRGPAIFISVACIVLLSTLATYYLSRRLLAEMKLNALVQNSLAAYIAIYALHLFYTGMEVILCIPLVFLVIVLISEGYANRGFWRAFGLGLVITAMILSRLDLILFAALILVFVLLNAQMRRSITREQVLGVSLGMVPLAAYFLMNHFIFHTWFPVSGMAKQLKINYLPTLRPWASFYNHNANHLMNLIPVHAGLLCLPWVWKRLTPTQRVLFPATLFSPFFYLLVLCCLSDWQIWLWYLYPLRAAMCLSFVVLSILRPTRQIVQTRVFALLVVVIVFAQVATSRWWTDVQPAIYAAAVDIQNFSKSHPGIYAMGDRSGMVGYLLQDPVIQTEGLMMDRAFLEKIRRQEPLLEVLADYHVRYYVGTAWAPYDKCFHAVEPFQAGKTSMHMTADFCTPAIADSQHEMYRTRIFDLAH